MAPRKHILRVLGLSLIAAIGLLAIGAAAAQAEGEWKIGGKTLPELKIEEESVNASLDGTFTYTVPSLSLEIKCLKMDSLKGRVLLKGAGELSLLFLECTFFAGKSQEEVKACTVKDVSINASDSIVLHGGKTYLLFKPLEGKTTFLTYTFEGAECVIAGTSHAVGGSFAVDLESEKVTQTLKLGNSTADALLGDEAKLVTAKVSLAGTLLLSLSGAQAGKAWGGI
jgi:hypothetical protein